MHHTRAIDPFSANCLQYRRYSWQALRGQPRFFGTRKPGPQAAP